MPIYAKKVQTMGSRFTARSIEVVSAAGRCQIPVPNDVVLCNGCNKNLYPEADCLTYGYLVYLSKRELAADRPYDLYCENCLRHYFPKVIVV